MKLIFLGDYCACKQAMPKLAPDISDFFQSSDLICVNFEAPIVLSNSSLVSKAGPAISQPVSSLQICHELGISHFSLANNHIMDYGRAGLVSTLKHIKSGTFFGVGLDFEQAYQPCWINCWGMNIALISFAEAQFGALQDEHFGDHAGYAWVGHPRARQTIREAREKADWLIVQVHAGLEMVDLPLPEWRQCYRELIDLGADLVIGHHPHVLQGSEFYKGKMIHYSLGNFFMDIMLRQYEQGSGAALQVTIDETGLHSEIIPLHISQTQIDLDLSGEASHRYQALCQKLVNNQAYYEEIQKICNEFWKEIYSCYYESALLGIGTHPNLRSVWQFFLRLGMRMLKGSMNFRANELMLIHNIRIETHRWVVERALANRGDQ
jgi:poly-gamma-glutamate synthesis protein (capsule biosynthesis protein)